MGISFVGENQPSPVISAVLGDRPASAVRACRRLRRVLTHDSTVDLRRLAEICAEYGVARLEVFGSVSRGDARPDSDIDVLYELAPGSRLGWKIEDLADELTEVLGRPVDLISRNALHEQLRESVLGEARVLYAA